MTPTNLHLEKFSFTLHAESSLQFSIWHQNFIYKFKFRFWADDDFFTAERDLLCGDVLSLLFLTCNYSQTDKLAFKKTSEAAKINKHVYLQTTFKLRESSRPEPEIMGFSALHLSTCASSSGSGMKLKVLITTVSLLDSSNCGNKNGQVTYWVL